MVTGSRGRSHSGVGAPRERGAQITPADCRCPSPTYYQAENGDLVPCDGSTEDVWEDLPAGYNDTEDKLARKFYEDDLKKSRVEIEGSGADLEMISQEAKSTYGDFEC